MTEPLVDDYEVRPPLICTHAIATAHVCIDCAHVLVMAERAAIVEYLRERGDDCIDKAAHNGEDIFPGLRVRGEGYHLASLNIERGQHRAVQA